MLCVLLCWGASSALLGCRTAAKGEWQRLDEPQRQEYLGLYAEWQSARALADEDPLRQQRLLAVAADYDDFVARTPEFFRASVDLQDVLLDADPADAERRYDPPTEPATAAEAVLAARFDWSDPDRARALLDSALGFDPNFAWAHHGIAVLERNAERWGSALEFADRAVALDPRFPEAARVRAEILEEIGDHADLVEAWREVLRVAPDDQEARHRYAHALLESDDPDDARRAEAALWALREAFPEGNRSELGESLWIAATHDLGVALTRQGRFEESLNLFLEVLRDDSENLRSIYNVGLVLEKLDRKEEALGAYETYLAKAGRFTDPLGGGDVLDNLVNVPDHVRRLRAELGRDDEDEPDAEAPEVNPEEESTGSENPGEVEGT